MAAKATAKSPAMEARRLRSALTSLSECQGVDTA